MWTPARIVRNPANPGIDGGTLHLFDAPGAMSKVNGRTPRYSAPGDVRSGSIAIRADHNKWRIQAQLLT